ncbi:MAG: bifunctional 3,4-dihydroxy-2-butanone-4-phosphate synthase/GTP cyclohydrolase II [Ilumatobacteraceae bacterium]
MSDPVMNVPADDPTAVRFDPVPDAIAAIARGEIVVVADDEDRENEGDLIMAADAVTEEHLAFFVRHTSGVICVGLPPERCDELRLPLMVPPGGNTEAQGTAFTVSVDLRDGTSTGISAADRTATLRALADPDIDATAFNRPGHIFPLRARLGGVLKRAGHTEAAVDLTRLAGRRSAGVLCELVRDDGRMARVPDLRAFADEHGLLLVSIADLIRHRRRTEKLVERTADARVPTEWGDFRCYAYASQVDGDDTHLAFVRGDVNGADDVLVRVHSECITGDVFASVKCDCGAQLREAMRRIAEAGRGVLVYLRGHEGRGIGITHKLRAYDLQDAGADTLDANLQLGLPVDSREYGVGAQILVDLGLSTIRLLTNNPAKYGGINGFGLTITERVPLHVPLHPEAQRYVDTKRTRMGHLFPDDIPESDIPESDIPESELT